MLEGKIHSLIFGFDPSQYPRQVKYCRLRKQIFKRARNRRLVDRCKRKKNSYEYFIFWSLFLYKK